MQDEQAFVKKREEVDIRTTIFVTSYSHHILSEENAKTNFILVTEAETTTLFKIYYHLSLPTAILHTFPSLSTLILFNRKPITVGPL